jgi:hypothetical protein
MFLYQYEILKIIIIFAPDQRNTLTKPGHESHMRPHLTSD